MTRIFLAGATGAVGRRLVPLLVAAGHRVTAATRTAEGVERLRAQGAEPVRLDVLDRDAVAEAVAAAAPEAVIHQVTALSGGSPADNARVRREGTRNLVDAAKRSGVRRVVAQSISWAYEPGDAPADESTPLDTAAPEPRATSVSGVVALEEAVAELDEHVVLRYGTFYGPGTWYAPGGLMAGKLADGALPAHFGVSSFVHVEDAARAAVQALQWPSGAVNVVDDEPAAAREWVPALAAALGVAAPEPTEGGAGWERGATNSRARELGWRPRFPSWRTGFAEQG
ncbi:MULTISPECIES: NAD-dependent epimerase/dehydratase family protein [Streptomyces]|uniref:NAD-dependent epimerase/dehydratase family protein n=1 Tax=Streptomyces TaxID=1883 RepID=UPI0022492D07|nr:NAD(P)-dependent oxidoreductase [Streptomyces sp. JHD 1]MCX2971396.1 NAD(P)-dependent oxidoreductase [Streptomyces sp. JHD 1]